MNKLFTFISIAAVLFTVTLAFNSGRPTHPTSDKEIARTTVFVVRLDGRSGGTGVILSSKPYESTILTNSHVCQVVKNGGLVISDTKQGFVSSYKVSEVHDLCLITTNIDMGVTTEVASSAPDLYSSATVSGHPHLLNTLVIHGHFSHKTIVNVMTGIKPCTQEDLASPNGFLCILAGGIPQFRTYQAQLVSVLIQPGNSGSAVFSSSGYIAGLVFAGAADLSYGQIVPAEYVKNFVDKEAPNLESQTPNTGSTPADSDSESKLKVACDNKMSTDYHLVKKYCNYLNNDLIYTDDNL
jgi:S1-C subfamily serine protease